MNNQANGKAVGAKKLAASMTPEQRKERATKAADARWKRHKSTAAPKADGLPVALYKGALDLLGADLPCYVLNNGQRVIGRTAYTEALTKIKGGGDLEKYLGVSSLRRFIDLDLVLEGMVAFSLPEVEGLERNVKGLPADLAVEIWRGFVNAMAAHLVSPERVLTARQMEMAIHASALLGACAKVGLDALIDEATGAQYDRASDALRVKLKAYLEDEMRKWEKTFPDDLWVEFARLTNWKGTVTQRPKYWGKLVMELVYGYLDSDVAKWLKDNAPEPKKGQNYHQWLSGQYGLKKLVEHIWMLIGTARTCENMVELRRKMAEMNGKTLVQFSLPWPNDRSN